jgi:acetyltransferase
MSDPQNLARIFRPECVAVVGASDKAGSVGHAVYANLKSADPNRHLIPINPLHTHVQGDPAWPTLNQVTATPDLVVVCTPAAAVPELARTCGERNVPGMIVLSAGFRESGEEGMRLEAELRTVLRQYPRLRLIGPNCLGVLAPHSLLNASFSATMPRPGGLAVISQSGALCTAMLDWAQDRELGFSAVVSVGNMVDVGMGDLIEYFAADKQTTAILLYMESLTDASHFMAAAQACCQIKPIIVMKAGRFAESSHAALSHTGALAGVDAVYDTAFRRAGIERVLSSDELFDCAKLLEKLRPATGSRLAIVTNAGGPGIMATDAWLEQGGQMAVLNAVTVNALNSALPSQWSHGNPVDVLGDAHADRFFAALAIVANDPGVDSLIVILTPQSMTDPLANAQAVVTLPIPDGKPLLAVWMGGSSMRAGRHVFETARIPVYVTPEQAVKALGHLVSLGRLREQVIAATVQPASTTPSMTASDRVGIDRLAASERRDKWTARLANSSGLLGEVVAKEMLADYGIPVVSTSISRSATEAAEIAIQCGFPVVLKILSPDISHKTDVGGVELNIADTDAVILAYGRMIDTVSQRQPGARIEGVSVQHMVSANHEIELLLGANRDVIFGPVVVVGSGGITAEIQHDVAMQLLPLSKELILSMLRDLRIFPILTGYRGQPGVNLAQLVAVILRFSHLVADRPELQSIEINPLIVTENQIIALDARVIVTPNVVSPVDSNQAHKECGIP